MKTLKTAAAFVFVLTVFSQSSTAAEACAVPRSAYAADSIAMPQMLDEFSSSRRGRRNTAIAVGVAAGLLGVATVGVGAYPYFPYPDYPYRYYGYYGPHYPYYGPPGVNVRGRKVRCWVYDPYRGIRYRTYCYR
jgi:hypothetical protein